MNQSGQQLGRFKLLALLGTGGFATVFRAEDTELGRQVAIKLLHLHLAANAVFVRRFRAEARANARLRHPNIVTIYEVGLSEDDRTYLVMELIEGVPLSKFVEREGPLAPSRVEYVVRQLAGALDYMHSAGLAHRDLKPSNVVVRRDDTDTLMDFGIARDLDDQAHLNTTGEMIGTPAYMVPEQISGADVGAAADIHSLGIIAYELIAGWPPFTGSTSEVIDQQRFQLPPQLSRRNLSVYPAVARAIEHALSKDPAARPGSAGAFVAGLCDGGATQVLPRPAALPRSLSVRAEPAAATPVSTMCRPRRLPAAVGALVLVALAALAGAKPLNRGNGDSVQHAGVAAGIPAGVVPSPVTSTPAPAVVSAFKVCDDVAACKETDFQVDESLFACFALTSGGDAGAMAAVTTSERPDPPAGTNDAGVVARSDEIPQQSGSNCYVMKALSPPLPAGAYSVWLLQNAAVLAHTGFRATDPPLASAEPEAAAPTPEPPAPAAPQPVVRAAAPVPQPQPIAPRPQPVATAQAPEPQPTRTATGR